MVNTINTLTHRRRRAGTRFSAGKSAVWIADEVSRGNLRQPKKRLRTKLGQGCAAARRGWAGENGQGRVSARPGWAGENGQGRVSARPGWVGENKIVFTLPSVDGSTDHPMTVINHIDQQTCQVHP